MIELTWYIIVLIIVVGVVVGFINTIAGSGSLITLPLLMFLGLPANVANGTNRLNILFTSVVGVASFRQQKVFKIRNNIWLSIPAVVGAIIGALIAVDLNEELMTKVIGILMVLLFFTIIYKPQKWLKKYSDQNNPKYSVWQYVFMFVIGMYGGFIQIGTAVFILSSLVLTAGFDVVKANAVKLFIILIYTIFALAIFIFNDQVNFVAGLLLGVGSMLGSYLATKIAVSWGPKVVRIVLMAVVVFSAIKFLGIFEFVIKIIKST